MAFNQTHDQIYSRLEINKLQNVISAFRKKPSLKDDIKLDTYKARAQSNTQKLPPIQNQRGNEIIQPDEVTAPFLTPKKRESKVLPRFASTLKQKPTDDRYIIDPHESRNIFNKTTTSFRKNSLQQSSRLYQLTEKKTEPLADYVHERAQIDFVVQTNKIIQIQQQAERTNQQREVNWKKEYVLEQKVRIALDLVVKYPQMASVLTHAKVNSMRIEDIVKLSAKLDWRFQQNKAAIRIQRFWRTRNNRPPNPLKIFSRMLKELRAVVRIQKWWRKMIFRSGKRMVAMIKNSKAIIIQRYLRKTILRSKAELFAHIAYCRDYFNDMRTKVFTNSQIIIAFRWRRYWKKKQKKLAEEAAKLAKKKALAAAKKGKKGKGKKKKGKKAAKKKDTADKAADPETVADEGAGDEDANEAAGDKEDGDGPEEAGSDQEGVRNTIKLAEGDLDGEDGENESPKKQDESDGEGDTKFQILSPTLADEVPLTVVSAEQAEVKQPEDGQNDADPKYEEDEFEKV